MASWSNATAERTASTKGVLHPVETARVAALRRDDPVSPPLRPFVERYWSVRWDRAVPYAAQVLGHPCVNLSVESGDRPRFGAAMPAVLVHGAATRRFTVELAGTGRVTAVKFRPGGFSALTGRPPAPDTVAPLGDELPVDAAALLRAVLGSEDDCGDCGDGDCGDDDAARTAALDAALTAALEPPDPPPAYLDLLAVLARMLADRDLVRVEQVAALAGTSVRGLQRLFAAYVGIGPKAVLARYRLHDAVAALDAGERDLAGLAAALGWFDHAHFCRDFRAAVGTTPSAYLAAAR